MSQYEETDLGPRQVQHNSPGKKGKEDPVDEHVLNLGTCSAGDRDN